ncbi:PREDICTED: pleckstrin homology domain-containing family A member 4 [Gekko japonicus]|uniref:Pleckstrin homology domain-containing family A member 4 n=1 Tax=Gekko japonicus TaxID=146911 RepID=A0ABM1KJX4_GEKJA|nr:PREDICTED: pleckstrin homology domain-containing family A member 4 [Gekko japonicus]
MAAMTDVLEMVGTMSEGDRPRSGLSQASSTATITSISMGTKPHSARPVRKVHTFGKRSDSIKRDPNQPVIMRGWLHKKDSSGLKLWKRRWFVLSNYCLFYYRDSREEMVLGSIPLPSYEIRTAFSKEKKNRRFVFKAEHPGMRTYYFSAETQLDMNSWIRAMNQSAAAECDYGNYYLHLPPLPPMPNRSNPGKRTTLNSSYWLALTSALTGPHSASSSYLHLPPLPPMPNRSNPGKRTTYRSLVRERSIRGAGGQQFESDTDALLTKLCGQDKILRGLEEEISQFRTEKERLEKALEVTRLQLEEFKGQDATMEKICCQRRQLQDDLVQVRARLCDLALDSDRAWEDYSGLESELQLLKGSLEHIRNVGHPQDQASAQQDLWRIHDILAGLKASLANYPTTESRRTGASPASTPTLDSHLGVNHSPMLPCSGEEKESETAPSPGPSLCYHEAASSHVSVTQEPGRTVGQSESRQQDSPSAGQQPNPSSSSRGQQGAPRHSDGIRRCLIDSSGEPLIIEKSIPVREAEGSDRGNYSNLLCEDGSRSRAKVVSPDTTAPRRSRMSAQEQLDRMQRNQEAQRKSEATQLSPPSHWRDSLKRGSSRPLPNTPPESSPKEGVQNVGPKPRCPPTPEWERQRVIQLSYALAAEASQRGKHMTGKTSSRSSLDKISGSRDSLEHHHLPSDSNSDELELSSVASKHNQTNPQKLSCRGDSRAANHTLPSSQTPNHVSCASEASNWSSPLSEETNQASSQPKVPKSTLHRLESTNEEPSRKSPPWVAPLPPSANQNFSVSRTTNWDSPPFWDCEMWASEQSPVGNQGPSNGRCLGWRGEKKSHQVVYIHDTAQPIKVTLVKSSF